MTEKDWRPLLKSFILQRSSKKFTLWRSLKLFPINMKNLCHYWSVFRIWRFCVFAFGLFSIFVATLLCGWCWWYKHSRIAGYMYISSSYQIPPIIHNDHLMKQHYEETWTTNPLHNYVCNDKAWCYSFFICRILLNNHAHKKKLSLEAFWWTI